MTGYALARQSSPSGMRPDAFTAATGLHPQLVVQLIKLWRYACARTHIGGDQPWMPTA